MTRTAIRSVLVALTVAACGSSQDALPSAEPPRPERSFSGSKPVRWLPAAAHTVVSVAVADLAQWGQVSIQPALFGMDADRAFAALEDCGLSVDEVQDATAGIYEGGTAVMLRTSVSDVQVERCSDALIAARGGKRVTTTIRGVSVHHASDPRQPGFVAALGNGLIALSTTRVVMTRVLAGDHPRLAPGDVRTGSGDVWLDARAGSPVLDFTWSFPVEVRALHADLVTAPGGGQLTLSATAESDEAAVALEKLVLMTLAEAGTELDAKGFSFVSAAKVARQGDTLNIETAISTDELDRLAKPTPTPLP